MQLDKIRNLGYLQQNLTQQLKDSTTANLDVQVLLAYILNRSRSWILSHPEAEITQTQEELLSEAFIQLRSGVPLPYVIGKWEFYNLTFHVTPDVLIPRPETELIVENAIQWLKKNPSCRLGVDIGTGSGCIAISLAVNIPNLILEASDISDKALSIARRNAEDHNVVDRISFYQANLFNPKSKSFDIIIANLPYIPTETLHGLEVYGREPTLALNGGTVGFDLNYRFLKEAPTFLETSGVIFMEIEAQQGEIVLETAVKYFPNAEISLQPDLSGFDRMLRIQT